MQKIGISTRCSKACAQCRLEHIARTAGVLADDNTSLVFLAVVPAEIAAYLKCMHDRKVNIRFPAEAVSSEIFSHDFMTFSLSIRGVSELRLCHVFLLFFCVIVLKYESIPASSALTKSRNPTAEVFDFQAREVCRRQGFVIEEGFRLVNEQNEACGAIIRLKTGFGCSTYAQSSFDAASLSRQRVIFICIWSMAAGT